MLSNELVQIIFRARLQISRSSRAHCCRSTLERISKSGSNYPSSLFVEKSKSIDSYYGSEERSEHLLSEKTSSSRSCNKQNMTISPERMEIKDSLFHSCLLMVYSRFVMQFRSINVSYNSCIIMVLRISKPIVFLNFSLT